MRIGILVLNVGCCSWSLANWSSDYFSFSDRLWSRIKVWFCFGCLFIVDIYLHVLCFYFVAEKAQNFGYTFLTFFILYNNLIPISLPVTLEVRIWPVTPDCLTGHACLAWHTSNRKHALDGETLCEFSITQPPQILIFLRKVKEWLGS